MNLNINREVTILNNNNIAQVMNEKYIKKSTRMYMIKFYDKDNSTMQKFKEKLTISKIKN